MPKIERLAGPKGELADLVFKLGAIQINLEHPWTLHSGLESPIYLNWRTSINPKPGPITSEALDRGGRLLFDRVYGYYDGDEAVHGFRYLAGVPNAGDPWARALHAKAHTNKYYPGLLEISKSGDLRVANRSSESEQGYDDGDRVLLIENHVSAGDSCLEAAGVVEKHGLVVSGIVTLVDGELGGLARLWEAGYRAHALFTISELIVHYVASGTITAKTGDSLLAFVHDHQI